MKGSLSLGILFDETVDLGLKKTVCNFMSEYDFPHVNIFLIERVVELDALQFVGSFLALLDESIPLFNVADLAREVFVLLFPQLFVFVV